MMMFLYGLPWQSWQMLPVIRLVVGLFGALVIYAISIYKVANQIKEQISN